MYALAFYPEDGEDLPTLDRKLRNWLGQNAEPGSWDTSWAAGNSVCPAMPPVMVRNGHVVSYTERECVRALIENDNDAAMLRLTWSGRVDIIARYNHCIVLADLNLNTNYYDKILDYTRRYNAGRMWVDGILLYYTDESDLVLLKLRFGGDD